MEPCVLAGCTQVAGQVFRPERLYPTHEIVRLAGVAQQASSGALHLVTL